MKTDSPIQSCFWCRGIINFGVHTDHVVPRHKGGPDESWNLVRACQPCNSAKSYNWPSVFVSRKLTGHLAKMRQKYGEHAQPGLCVSVPSWRCELDWEAHVLDRELFAISVEGLFQNWAANSGDERALQSIRRRRQSWDDASWMCGEPDRMLVQEVQQLRGWLDYYRDETDRLASELAAYQTLVQVGS